MYAPTSELAVLCQVLSSEFPGAFYAPHHRSYGHRAIESYDEMIQLGHTTGCPIRKLIPLPRYHVPWFLSTRC